MKRKKLLIAVLGVAVVATGWTAVRARRAAEPLLLTGVVTANDIVVSPLVAGRVNRLFVDEGSTVTANQVVATLQPDELQADRRYFERSAEALGSEVAAAEAELAASESHADEARATLADARRAVDRARALLAAGAMTEQEVDAARTAYTVAEARAAAADRQVANRRSAIAAARHQQSAATAQTAKASVRLAYSEITAPAAGIVDVRAVRAGEVVTAGQPILTIVDPDSLWVRADVDESYIDLVRLGDTLTVRLPSGIERTGTVIYRGVDADFATQRDVSRSKRDVKTFEVRLRVDNRDRRLALGMSAYVVLPVNRT